MKLGDLEFKAEDFHQDVGFLLAQDVADNANRILAEKLEKARKIRGHLVGEDYFHPFFVHTVLSMENAPSHTARLVCIEEIKK